MLLILLVIVLAAWGAVCLQANRLDVSSPGFFNFLIWTFVSFIAALNLFYWKYDISILTFTLVAFSCLFFSVGAGFASCAVKKRYYDTINDTMVSLNKKLLHRFLVIYTISGFILLYLNIVEKDKILRSLGQSFSSDNFLFYLRHKEALGYSGGTNSILSLLINFLQGVSVFVISIIVRSLMRKDFRIRSKKFLLFILSQIPILGCDFLSTGRDGFIRYFTIVLICILCYMKKYSNTRAEALKKGLKYALRVFASVVIVFLTAGVFTGKTSEGSVGAILSRYISGALLAFDKAAISPSIATDKSLRSLYGLYYLGNRFFGIGGLASSRADRFITVSNNLYINIYTAFFDYYSDFGYIGTIFIYTIFGMVCGYIYAKTKTKNYEFWIPLYAYYAYAMVRQITEAFFLKMAFTENHLVMMFSIYISYKLLKEKVFREELKR